MRRFAFVSAALLALFAGPAYAGAEVGGYFRVMTRPDFVGGDGKLGYWNLYGRLLNEGPYGALELKLDVLERQPGSDAIWTDLHVKIEGGSIGNADAGNGSLSLLRLSQVYAQAGNILLPGVTWRVGTLESTFGDLGLYDWRPAQVLFDTVGVQAEYDRGPIELIVGAGDAGYAIRGAEYNTIASAGGTVRLRGGSHVELGAGGQYRYEPKVVGNRFAPYNTPDISYDDYIRGEFVQNYLLNNPGESLFIPAPTATSSTSSKLIGYLGAGNAGPLKWNNLFVSFEKLHPDNFYTEIYNGASYDLYIQRLTDQRTVLFVGDELQLSLWPDRLDAAIGGVYGNHKDGDNQIAPSDFDRTYWSGVVRTQAYLSPVVHLLLESSYAKEWSRNGNTYRDHADSIFTNSGGQVVEDGLEYGDSDTRITWQGKGGFVLNPLGPGIYTRPSLRLLYGAQHSTQNNAFGNSFVETIDDYDYFGNVERHWHHVVAVETEIWF